MTRQVRLREVLASVEGLALLRRLYEGTDEEAAARITDLRDTVCVDEDPVLSGAVPVREVTTRTGTPSAPRRTTHLHGDHLRAFARAGLRVDECVEPRFAEEAPPSKRRAMERIPEATRLAYEGLPAVLVWALTRR